MGLETLATDKPLVTVKASGRITLDFGTERAGWLEFESPDLTPEMILASVSEYSDPWPGKTKVPKQYGSTFRLETNAQLYEGLRFGFLDFTIKNASQQFTLGAVTTVAQIKPVNYTSFSVSSDLLTKVWYTGAYGVRLNMLENVFGSILMDRGDRVCLQGDSHPTMAAGLASVPNYDLTVETLDYLNSVNHSVIDSGIMAYPVYWVMSALDYYHASGDKATFLRLMNDLATVLTKAASNVAVNANIVWMG